MARQGKARQGISKAHARQGKARHKQAKAQASQGTSKARQGSILTLNTHTHTQYNTVRLTITDTPYNTLTGVTTCLHHH